MADIAQALEGLLDANLDEIETIHSEIEWLKQHRADIVADIAATQDLFHEKLKALRDSLLAAVDKDIAEHEARVLRLNGQEPPPADIVRFPRSQQMTARAE